MESRAQWHRQATGVAELCQRFLSGLVGVYVHGSAALGGMNRGSDLDILVVTTSGDGAADLGRSLLANAGEPHDLELSVVTADDARRPREPWPYVLHVNTAEDRIQADSTTGDPDLVAHYAVTRAAGITLIGPVPEEVIGPTATSYCATWATNCNGGSRTATSDTRC